MLSSNILSGGIFDRVRVVECFDDEFCHLEIRNTCLQQGSVFSLSLFDIRPLEQIIIVECLPRACDFEPVCLSHPAYYALYGCKKLQVPCFDSLPSCSSMT